MPECPNCDVELEYEAFDGYGECPTCKKKWEVESEYLDYDNIVFWATGKEYYGQGI